MILPNEVSSNAGLQQSTHRTCDIANLKWIFPLTQPFFKLSNISMIMTTHELSYQAQDFGGSVPDSYLSFIKKVGSGDETNLMAEVCRCLGFEKTHTAVSDYSFHCEVYLHIL